MSEIAPILEFDNDRSSILNPETFNLEDGSGLPNIGVLCFFQDVLAEFKAAGSLRVVDEFNWEIGPNPLYIYHDDAGKPVTVMHPGVGAPLAAGYLEELIALGVTRFIVCGGAGVLNREIAVGHPVILYSAVRDEGTSYHYLSPAREVEAHPKTVKALKQVFSEAGIEHLVGKSWTTDAPYRETKGKRKLRLQEDCLVVEMEAAALFAVAQFREIMVGQVVYGGDLVVPEGWDKRGWADRKDSRRLLFEMAIKAARLLA